MQVPASTVSLVMHSYDVEGRTVLALEGGLDAATAPRLSEELAALSRRGVIHLDLDLSRLDFMDSSGLSVVLAAHKRTGADGGGLIIHHPNRRVIRLFQVNGLMSYLVVEPRMWV